MNKALNRIQECGNIFYGNATGYTTAGEGVVMSNSGGGGKTYGAQVETLQSILANLTKLAASVDSILDQVAELF